MILSSGVNCRLHVKRGKPTPVRCRFKLQICMCDRFCWAADVLQAFLRCQLFCQLLEKHFYIMLRFSVSETSGHRANWLLFISSASILVCITSSVFVFASICASAFSLLSMAIVDKAAGSVCAMLSRDCLVNFSMSSCDFFAKKTPRHFSGAPLCFSLLLRKDQHWF